MERLARLAFRKKCASYRATEAFHMTPFRESQWDLMRALTLESLSKSSYFSACSRRFASRFDLRRRYRASCLSVLVIPIPRRVLLSWRVVYSMTIRPCNAVLGFDSQAYMSPSRTMQEASGRSCRTSQHRPEDAVGIYLPAFCRTVISSFQTKDIDAAFGPCRTYSVWPG